MRVAPLVVVDQQPRHHRDADAARHQLLHRVGVVGAHDGVHRDVELGQRRRQHALGRDAAVLRDQRAPRQVGHLERPAERRPARRRRARSARRRRAGSRSPPARRCRRRSAPARGRGRPPRAARAAGRSGSSPRRGARRRVPAARSATASGGMTTRATLRTVPSRTTPATLGGVGAQVAVGLDEALADRRGVRQQPAPGVGQLDVPRAGRAHEQLDPDDALERADLLADGRLRVAEPLGGAAHRPRLGHGRQRAQVAQVDPRPVSRSGDARDDSPTCSAAAGPRCSR